VLQTPLGALLQQPKQMNSATHKSSRAAYSVAGAKISYPRLSTTFADSQRHSVNVQEPPGFRGEPICYRGEEFLSGTSAGSGAYSVMSRNPQEETVMSKWGDYFLGVADSAPAAVRLRYGLEGATMRTLIAQGAHDIASQWLPPEVTKALAEDGAQLLTENGSGGFYLAMNTTKAPLDDVNCRLAMRHAFDYGTAIQMIAVTDDVPTGSPATGAIPVGMFVSNGLDSALVQDMDKAKQYLADCKYDVADMNIEVSWIAEVSNEERFALLFQTNLSQLGVKSEIKKLHRLRGDLCARISGEVIFDARDIGAMKRKDRAALRGTDMSTIYKTPHLR